MSTNNRRITKRQGHVPNLAIGILLGGLLFGLFIAGSGTPVQFGTGSTSI